MNQPSYKERERQRREREIIINARRLIHDSGFTGLNMDELANSVGISKPTLYQHFKSKEDLAACVILSGMEELNTLLNSTAETSPLERLKEVLRTILVHRYTFGGLLENIESELLSSTIYSHDEVLAVKRRIMGEVNQIVEQGKTQGEISTDIPTQLISCQLFRLTGLPATVQIMFPQDASNHKTESVDIMIENVIMLFVRSIAMR